MQLACMQAPGGGRGRKKEGKKEALIRGRKVIINYRKYFYKFL
jgi:hypothetical protein